MPNPVIVDVNYAAEYSLALAQQYPYLSYFAALLAGNNSNRYKAGMGKTMYIPSITVNGARAVNRDQITGVFNRNWNNKWQAVELQMDREWDTLADPMDLDETSGAVSIANITRAYVEQQKIPEMDAFIASKMAEFASAFGGVSTASLSAATILDEWDNALAYMTNQRVNRDRVVAYMTPATYKLLKQATGMTRFIEVTNGIRDVDRNIARLDGVTVIEVPEDMMKTAYDFSQGWAVDEANAKQINFLLVDPEAVAVPVKYETAMVSAPSAQSKGKYLYYERYYYGAFCLSERQAGVYANLSAAPSLGALTVSSAAGAVAGSTVIGVDGHGISGNGLDAGLKLVYSVNDAAVSLTYNAVPDATKTWTEASAVPFTLTSQTAGKYITAALVNRQTGKVVAGGNTVLVVGA
jgi:hypothetical protein